MNSSRQWAGGIIGGIGLLLSAVHVLHIIVHDKPLLATVVGAGVPLTVSLLIVAAGYWTTRQHHRPSDDFRLVQWTVLGGGAMGLLIGTITAHQHLAGHVPDDAEFQLATALTGGALGGFLVGVYNVQVQRRSDRIEALQSATGDFVEATTKAEVCEQVVQLADSELGWPLTGAWLYDETDDVLEPVAVTQEGDATFEQYPTYEPGKSLSWQAFTSGELRVYADLNEHPDRLNQETVVRSEMILPLGSHGVLNIGSTDPDAFDDVDVATAQLLASAVHAVLDRVEREEELRIQQQDLETQNERLNEFASIVSHDLRNPLSVARGHLELAQEDCDSPSLNKVEAAHQRMESLITDLLQLSRAGQTIEETARVSLEAVASDAWQMVETSDATTEFYLDEFTIDADESRLRQLFENLFRNAIEHAGSDVTVRVGELDDRPGFYVEDDGPGVPADDRDQIFDLGYTTRKEGSGLGLITVRRVAEAHGWSVSVTDGPDGGARFEIYTE